MVPPRVIRPHIPRQNTGVARPTIPVRTSSTSAVVNSPSTTPSDELRLSGGLHIKLLGQSVADPEWTIYYGNATGIGGVLVKCTSSRSDGRLKHAFNVMEELHRKQLHHPTRYDYRTELKYFASVKLPGSGGVGNVLVTRLPATTVSLRSIMAHYGNGQVPAVHVGWMFNRILIALAHIYDSCNLVHGCLSADSLLFNTRLHSPAILDWEFARTVDTAFDMNITEHLDTANVPPGVLDAITCELPAGTWADLSMSAKCMILAGCDTMPSRMLTFLQSLVNRATTATYQRIYAEWNMALRREFGEPKFVEMPEIPWVRYTTGIA